MASNVQAATAFVPARVAHEFTQINYAEPERVFPLLCPVREAEWLPGWKYRLIYSRSGYAELDCVFTSPESDGSEKVWQCTAYDREHFAIDYMWVRAGAMTAHLEIRLARRPDGYTDAKIRYTYTSLSQAGNTELERMNEAWFVPRMEGWQTAINHYRRTGRLVEATE